MIRLLKCGAFVLGCIAAFVSSPAMAHAAAQNPSSEVLPQGLTSSASLAPGWDSPEDPSLPLRLDIWGAEGNTLLPQARMATKPPFIDFDKFEAGGFVGVVAFSSDFEADPDIIGGITARVPVPGLPGDWGIWASIDAAGMTRDIPFFYSNKSGTWYSGNIGLDYTFTNGDIWLLRAQAGVTYNYWNGLQSLDNNFAATVGLDIGFYWIKFNHRTTVNLNPQISFNGSNWYAILGIEFQVQF
jgi:hypothetical protein